MDRLLKECVIAKINDNVDPVGLLRGSASFMPSRVGNCPLVMIENAWELRGKPLRLPFTLNLPCYIQVGMLVQQIYF